MGGKEIKDLHGLADIPAATDGQRRYIKPFSRDTDTVEIVLDGEDAGAGEKIDLVKAPPAVETLSYSRKSASFVRGAPRPASAPGALAEERESDGRFIKKIRVYEWGGDYGFYEKFARDAVRYRDMHGTPAPHVPFFSYIPQYSQLKPPQFAFYLHLRDEIRAGRFPMADFSYILLFIYEIINLGDSSDNESDARLLASVWIAYRSVYPALDKYLSEWVADYCIIHSVRFPDGALSIVPAVCERSTFKEYYAEAALSASGETGFVLFSDCLISAFSDFDLKRSRYLSDDADLYRKFRLLFSECVSEMIRRNEGLFSNAFEREVTLKRDAFTGSLCSYNVKKKLELTLLTPFRSVEMRKTVTELLRYCENRVRQLGGIRSRLSVDLSDSMKRIVDSRPASRSENEAYMRAYDAPDDDFSIGGAIDLENSSWDNTDRLVVPEEDEWAEEQTDGAISYDPLALSGSPEEKRPEAGPDRLDIVRSLISGAGKSFSELCRERGLFPDGAASEINEYFTDVLGDVILERSDGDYELIEDYKDDIVSFFNERSDAR